MGINAHHARSRYEGGVSWCGPCHVGTRLCPLPVSIEQPIRVALRTQAFGDPRPTAHMLWVARSLHADAWAPAFLGSLICTKLCFVTAEVCLCSPSYTTLACATGRGVCFTAEAA